MATYGDLVAASLRELNVLAEGETASASMAADALTMLNWLLGQWGLEPLTSFTVTRTTKALTPSDGEYSVGASADINIVRPTRLALREVRLIDTSVSPNLETPLATTTDAEYAAIAMKTLTQDRPIRWYYNPTFPTGTLNLWPIPTNASLSIALYVETAIPVAAALATSVSLPPGYELALIKNLALMLAPSYGRQPNPLLVKQAQDAEGSMKRANDTTDVIRFDFMGGSGRHFDFRRGGY